MLIYEGIEKVDSLGAAVVTIGNFDGVHLGHQEIIQAAISQSKKRGIQSVIFTFKPHPQHALRPEKEVQLLNTYEERLEQLEKTGVDVVVEQPFSREFSTQSPEVFFSRVLVEKLQAQAIVVGYDFGFGKGRSGQSDTLKKLCGNAQIDLTVIPPFQLGEEVVSSSKIRAVLNKGDVRQAEKWLGYHFFHKGPVLRGKGRGEKIGFPTANLEYGSKVKLPFGVYATRSEVGGNQYLSVTNVGVRPTFDQDSEPWIECYLLDQKMDLYGRMLKVSFIEQIRKEKKFSGPEELKDQIFKDIEMTKGILSR